MDEFNKSNSFNNDFDFTFNYNIISNFVNIAIATSKIKSLKLEQKNKNLFNLRPNMNLFIYGGIGGGKSTLLNEIVKNTDCKEPLTDLTFPALIGSIDKLTRQLIVGYCWEVRNSLLLLDEFDFKKRNKDDIRALLQLIEGGKYSRKIASFTMPSKEEEDDLFYKFESGKFQIKTRFSLIVATMNFPYYSKSEDLKALISRSVAIPFYPDLKQLDKMTEGEDCFKFKCLNVDKEIIIKFKDYKKIKEFVKERILKVNNYLRVVNDCCRVFAVLKEHNFKLYEDIIGFGNVEFKTANQYQSREGIF